MRLIRTQHYLGEPTSQPNHGGIETFDLHPPVEGAEIVSVTHEMTEAKKGTATVLWLDRTE